MKKITISKEGISPLDIYVDGKNQIQSVESSGKVMFSKEAYEISTEEGSISEEADLSKLNAVDRVFAEMARESHNPALSTEAAMPRLSGIKPFSFFAGRSMSRNVFTTTVDEYLKGQQSSIAKIKDYIAKQGWVDEGIAGLSKVPTIVTQMFKIFGLANITLASSRKNIIEKEVNGLKIVFIHTDNSNDSAINKTLDFRARKDKMVGYLILSKRGSDKFFCKRITPTINVQRKDNGKSRHNIEVSAKVVSKESSPVIERWAEISQESSFADFDGINPTKSEEGFPRVNSLLSITGTKMYKGVDDIVKDPKVIETCGRIKEYCSSKGWEIIKEEDSDIKKTLWTTFIGKDTSDYNRPRAKTETWKTVNGVPLMFLEFDEDRTFYSSDGFPVTYRVHYICAHVYLRKPGAKRIFSKQVISKVKLRSDKSRKR